MPSNDGVSKTLIQEDTGEGSREALWSRTVEAFLAHARETAVLINEVIARFPDDALAHLVKGYMLLLLGRAELVEPARSCLETGLECIGDGTTAARERLFAKGLQDWLAGNPRGAIRAMEHVIGSYPRDALAIKLSHSIRFLLGDLDGMRRSLSRVISVYGDDVPFAGYIRGCYAFALEETGGFAEAEAMGRRAVALAPRDAWGRHAVAHVLEMTGRANEGVDWLGGKDAAWSHCGNFGYHMFWHLALFQLELGRTAEALLLYDQAIRAEHTDDYRDIANAASLLQRLTLAGVDVGSRWEELADLAGRRTNDRRLVFADLHYMLALLGARRMVDVEALVISMLASKPLTHDGQVAAAVGVPLAEALLAFQAGRYAETVKIMQPVRALIRTIGGSHAQRDVFEQIYLEALVRSHDPDAGMALKDRIDRRGGHNLFAAARLGAVSADKRTPWPTAQIVSLTPLPIYH